jgi:hypothetical protein
MAKYGQSEMVKNDQGLFVKDKIGWLMMDQVWSRLLKENQGESRMVKDGQGWFREVRNG